jgi:hypothetical protein
MADELLDALRAVRAAKDEVDSVRYSPALDTPTRKALEGLFIDLDQAERTLLLDGIEQQIQRIKDCASDLNQGIQQLKRATQQLQNIVDILNKAATAIGIAIDILSKAAPI